MNKYVNFVEKIFQKYISRTTSNDWQDEIYNAQQCIFDKLESEGLWFYSGDLIDGNTMSIKNDKKYIFISMNPKYDASQGIQYKPTNLIDFINCQNTTFARYKKYHRASYGVYEKLIRQMEGGKFGNSTYSTLDKYAVVIDWFPFYSDKFKFLPNNLEYAKSLLENILAGTQHIEKKLVLAIGTAMESTLERLSVEKIVAEITNDEPFRSYITTDGAKRIRVFEYNDTNIFSFPLAYKGDIYLEEVANYLKKFKP